MRSLFIFLSILSFNVFSIELNVCYESWRPYAYKVIKDNYAGSVLSKLINNAKNTEIKLVLHELPHARCIAATKAKKLDFTLFVDKTDGLTMLSNELSVWEMAVATRAGEIPTKEQKLQADFIKKITIARDYIYPEALTKTLEKLNKPIIKASYYVKKKEDIYRIFRPLFDYRVDAMVVDKAWANMVKSDLSLPLEISTWTIHKEPQLVGYSTLSEQKLKAMITLLQ